mmetsp:Transcript_52581/g.132248  ORF Transcript_52581/g.132248 Transcript_52581/m.132248 type:complete len:354 (+) Transcript_52581:67-1128(+)
MTSRGVMRRPRPRRAGSTCVWDEWVMMGASVLLAPRPCVSCCLRFTHALLTMSSTPADCPRAGASSTPSMRAWSLPDSADQRSWHCARRRQRGGGCTPEFTMSATSAQLYPNCFTARLIRSSSRAVHGTTCRASPVPVPLTFPLFFPLRDLPLRAPFTRNSPLDAACVPDSPCLPARLAGGSTLPPGDPASSFTRDKEGDRAGASGLCRRSTIFLPPTFSTELRRGWLLAGLSVLTARPESFTSPSPAPATSPSCLAFFLRGLSGELADPLPLPGGSGMGGARRLRFLGRLDAGRRGRRLGRCAKEAARSMWSGVWLRRMSRLSGLGGPQYTALFPMRDRNTSADRLLLSRTT